MFILVLISQESRMKISFLKILLDYEFKQPITVMILSNYP
ncbi:unnamed protein product, partial [Onchocerca flexuosa]|uniref:Uncharacterized protein n=1 Tax=Onchocerca flexuosa TaxID=387005 RepID=A0A183H0P3_9BILA